MKKLITIIIIIIMKKSQEFPFFCRAARMDFQRLAAQKCECRLEI